MKLRFPVVLLLLATAWVLPAPAQAAACSGTSGVTVVVQFPDGHIETGCASGDPSSGIQALQLAGFSWEPVPGQMGATVCRINGQPAVGEKCWQPPDYWAYFYARPGGAWTYSSQGAGSRDPKPGGVEGWKFRGSESNPPSVPPPGAASTPTPTPRPTPHPTARPTGGASNPVVPPAATGEASPGGTPSAPDATATASVTPTTRATATDDSTPSTDPTSTVAVVEEPRATDPEAADASGGLSWLWGVLLVGVLAAAGGTTAVRRRRS